MAELYCLEGGIHHSCPTNPKFQQRHLVALGLYDYVMVGEKLEHIPVSLIFRFWKKNSAILTYSSLAYINNNKIHYEGLHNAVIYDRQELSSC